MKYFVLAFLLVAAPAVAQPAHIGPGAQTVERVRSVVIGTAAEYPAITAQGQNTDLEVELLRRMIWHLQLAGFDAGRQRNPSGAISGDKLTAFADGQWRIWDVLSDTPKGPFNVHFDEIPNAANSVPDAGIADEPVSGGGGSGGGVVVTDDALHRAILDAIAAHDAKEEAHWKDANDGFQHYFGQVMTFVVKYVLPAVGGLLLGGAVAQ